MSEDIDLGELDRFATNGLKLLERFCIVFTIFWLIVMFEIEYEYIYANNVAKVMMVMFLLLSFSILNSIYITRITPFYGLLVLFFIPVIIYAIIPLIGRNLEDLRGIGYIYSYKVIDVWRVYGFIMKAVVVLAIVFGGLKWFKPINELIEPYIIRFLSWKRKHVETII